MAKQYKTGLIITGDASGGIRAIKATDSELGKLNRGFDQGSRRSRQFNRDVNATSQGLAVLRRAVAPIAGVIAGMFAANTIKSQVDWGDQLQKTNLRIGASTEALSQYNYVAKLSGVEFGQLTTAWQRQTRRIAEAAQGTGVASKALEQLNLNAKELNQLAPEEQFERIAAAMQNVESSSERVALAQKLWDSEGVKLVQVVNQGTDAIAQMRAEADALGLTISQDTANAMATYNDEMDRLKFAAQGVSQALAGELVPAMTAGLQNANAFIQEVGGAEVVVGNLKDGATVLAALLAGRYAGAFVTVTAAKLSATQQAIAYQAALARMAGVSTTAAAAQTALAAATRAATGAMTLLGGPIGLLIGAGGLLYMFREELGLTTQKAGLTEQQISDLRNELKDMSQDDLSDSLASLNQSLEEATLKAAAAREQLANLRAERDQGQGPRAAFRTLEAGGYEAEVRGMRAVEEAEERLLEIQQRRNATYRESVRSWKERREAQEKANETTEEGIDVTKTAAAATREAAKQTTSLANSYESLLDRIQPNRRAARQYAQDVGVLNLALATGRMNTVQYMQAMGQLQEFFQAAQRETEKLGDSTVEAAFSMNEAWDDVRLNGLRRLDDGFADLWQGAIDGSRSASETMKRVLDQTLAELAHMAITRPIMVQIAGSMGMGGGQQVGMQGSDMQGMMNNINPGMLQSGWDTVSGWFGGGATSTAGGLYANAATQGAGTLYGSAATGAAQGGLYGNAATGGVAQGVGGAASGLYTAGAGYVGGIAGTALGESAFGKTANSSYGAMGGAIAGAKIGSIVPGIGNIIGAGIGAVVGGIGDALFGSNKKTYDFDFQQGGHYGVFGDRDSELGQFGITSFSDYKLGEQQDALQELMDSIAIFDNTLANVAIDERVDAMRASIEGFRHSGPEDLFDTRLRAIIDGSGALLEDAVAAIADPEQMADAFVSMLNIERLMQPLNERMQWDIAEHLNANTGDIQGTASSLGQAIEAVNLLGVSAQQLNLQFNDAAAGAIHSAWALQEAAGGLQAYAQLSDSYYQNYFSEAEREVRLREEITQAMRELGFQMPETRDGFRALIEAQNLNSEAGVKNVAALLQLESAFAQLTPAIEGAGNAASNAGEALRVREQLERQLLQAQGNTVAIRQLEIDRLGELETAEVDNLAALQRRIWAIEDEKTAQQEAERAQQERTRAIENESKAWSRARDQLTSFGNSIDGYLANLYGTEAGLGSPADQLAAASQAFYEQYDKAETGDRDAMNSITQYADRFIEAQKGWSASGAQTTATVDKVAGMLERLPDQLSPEQFLADEFKGALAEQTTTLATALDLNGDGTVSALERSIAADWATSDVLKSVLHQEMRRLGTTVLTDAQIRAALRPHATDAEIERLIRRVDVNGDGLVSQQELTNARIGGLTDGFANAIANGFDSIDIDGSGFIDYDEFRKAFAGMATDSELQRIFSKLDTDGSRSISLAEAQRALLSTIQGIGANAEGSIKSVEDFLYRAGSPSWGLRVSLSNHNDVAAVQSFGYHAAHEFKKMFSPSGTGLGVSLAAAQNGNGSRTIAAAFRDVMGPNGVNGSHASGLWNVGFDGYIAQLHKDEMVVPAGPANALRELASGSASMALPALPQGSRELPMPNVPLPNFPALGNNDVLQVLNDVKRELQETRKENKRLQEENNKHAAAAVVVQQAGFNGQISEQKKSNRALDDMSAAAQLEASR